MGNKDIPTAKESGPLPQVMIMRTGGGMRTGGTGKGSGMLGGKQFLRHAHHLLESPDCLFQLTKAAQIQLCHNSTVYETAIRRSSLAVGKEDFNMKSFF